jgi:hypothetical protein
MNWAISKLAPVSYRVDVEARGHLTALAGGLTAPVAAAILAAVSKPLRLQAQSAASAPERVFRPAVRALGPTRGFDGEVDPWM